MLHCGVSAADYCQNCPWRPNKKIPLNYLIISFLYFQHVYRHECWVYEPFKNKLTRLKPGCKGQCFGSILILQKSPEVDSFSAATQEKFLEGLCVKKSSECSIDSQVKQINYRSTLCLLWWNMRGCVLHDASREQSMHAPVQTELCDTFQLV